VTTLHCHKIVKAGITALKELNLHNYLKFNSFRVAKLTYLSPPIASAVIHGSSLSGLPKEKPQKKAASEKSYMYHFF
jgi:hypothetical protein